MNRGAAAAATRSFRGDEHRCRRYVAPDDVAGDEADAIACEVSDLGYAGAGGPRTATLEIPVDVTGVNDAPVVTAPAVVEVSEAAAAVAASVEDADAGDKPLTLRVVASAGLIRFGDVLNQPPETVGSVSSLNAKLASLTSFLPRGYFTDESRRRRGV